MKRFWTDVVVTEADDGHGIALDGRPVRTPGRATLAVPSRALADVIADEWRAVEGEIDPRGMPLTGLANAAIERVAPAHAAFAASLSRYAESDLLYYRAEDPAPLVERQTHAWDPVLAWARHRYDVHFETARGVMPVPQPRATLDRLAEATAARDAFALAGLSPVVTVTGSLLLALALAEGEIDADTAWTAARIDEDWQAEMWGQDDLATRTTAAHRADYDAGVRFMRLADRSKH